MLRCSGIGPVPATVRDHCGLRGCMRFGLVVLLALGFFELGNARDNRAEQGTNSPAAGLQIGARAPSFAARDQFGHEQSIETLRGSNGTVLLFFRSADW